MAMDKFNNNWMLLQVFIVVDTDAINYCLCYSSCSSSQQ